MSNSNIGYQEDPENSEGIIRARTTKQIRSWEIPRTMKALEVLNIELGRIEFPGIYILFEGKNKDRWRGRTPTNKLVFVESGQDLLGEVKPVIIIWTGPWSMQASLPHENDVQRINTES